MFLFFSMHKNNYLFLGGHKFVEPHIVKNKIYTSGLHITNINLHQYS